MSRLTAGDIADNVESRNAMARLDIMERRSARLLADRTAIVWRSPERLMREAGIRIVELGPADLVRDA